MKKAIVIVSWLFGADAMLGAGSAAAAQISCPPTINETPTAQTTDPQWIVIVKPGQRSVEQASLYIVADGTYGAQVPDSTVKTGKSEERVTWQITSSGTEKFAVGCTYTGTTAMLYKALDDGLRRCIATYALLPTGRRQRLQSMNCD